MATRSTPIERFLEASDSAGRRRKSDGRGGWNVQCPGPMHDHGDRKMRLHLSEGTGGHALVHCYVGCATEDVLHALGLAKRDLYADDGRSDVLQLRARQPRTIAEAIGTAGPSQPLPFVASPAVEVVEPTSCDLDKCAAMRKGTDLGQCVAQYVYRDAQGRVVGQVHRYDPKTFRPFTLDDAGQWKAGGRIRIPYRLPEVLAVLAAGGLVATVEGEKDADALAALGLDGVAATCNAGGAGKWTDDHSRVLAERIGDGAVCIVGDVDAAGQDHVRKVREALAAGGIDAGVQWPTKGKDLAEHLENGGALADLVDDVEGSEPVDVSSWTPLDLAGYLDGTNEPEVAVLLPRDDGQCLLYPGRVHSLHGESESGKSLVVQAEAARLIAAGKQVLYIDFESDARSVVPRLVAMGAPDAAIRQLVQYVRPHEPPTDAAGRAALEGLLSRQYALAVIDGLTDALGMFGASSVDLDDVSQFMREFPRRIARQTGAATVIVDHVTKAADTRGRFAVGSQAKMNALDGAAYVVEIDKPLGLGLRGAVKLRVAKDRPGSIRPASGPYRASDRTQHVATVVFDATGDDGRTVVTVQAPPALIGQEPQESGSSGPFRPTTIMEHICDYLATQSEPAPIGQIYERIGGRKQHVLQALDALIAEGHVTRVAGYRGAKLHNLARPYRQAEDPKSDRYAGRLGLGTPGGEPERNEQPERARQPEPTEPPGLIDRDAQTGNDDGEPLRPTDYGPCARCRTRTLRYGPHASGLLCEDCRAATAG